MEQSERPPIEEIAKRFKEAQANTVTALAKELGVSRQGLYDMVAAYEKQKAEEQGPRSQKEAHH